MWQDSWEDIYTGIKCEFYIISWLDRGGIISKADVLYTCMNAISILYGL